MDAKKMEAVRLAKRRVAETMPAGVKVVGVGIGLSGSEPALKVNLAREPADRSLLPRTIEGVPVVYDVVGKVTAR
jgi:hypothetical protein